MSDKHIPTFLSPTKATSEFWKRAAIEKMMEMNTAVTRVIAKR